MVKLRLYITAILTIKILILLGANNISGGYISYIDDENTAYLTLNDNNIYSLEIINETKVNNDISFSFLVSNGKYLINNDKLELVDNFNSFRLYFEITDKKLHCTNNSFIWLKNKTFNKQSNDGNIESYYSIFRNEDRKDLLAKNKSYNSRHNILFYGNYKSDGMDFLFSLYLGKNNKATYCFRDLVLLEGSFKKYKDNIICLTDNSLKHIFYFLIYKDAVKPIVFPHNKIVLKRKK